MDTRLFRGVFATAVCALFAVSAFADATVNASNSGPYCAGSSVLLYGSSSDPAATYSWNGPNNYASTDQNPVIANASADTAGTYTLTTSGTTATTNLVMNPNASINVPAHITTNDASHANGPDGATSYSWSIAGNGTLTGGQNAKTALFTAGAPGMIALTLSTGCSTVTQNVEVDPQPTISVNNVAQQPGPKGTSTPFTFRISLSAPSTQTVSVQYATSNQTAAAPKDFAYTYGTATFQAGDTYKDIPVLVNGTSSNPTKTFAFNLYNPQNATIQPIYGTIPMKGHGTILAK